MHMTVLFASPRAAHSNTRALLVPFLETWRAAGHTAEVFSLFDLHIESCRACRGCQVDWEHPACVLADDICLPYLMLPSAAISCCWPRPSTPGSAPRP